MVLVAVAWSLTVSAFYATILGGALYACYSVAVDPSVWGKMLQSISRGAPDPERGKGHNTIAVYGKVEPGPKEIVAGCVQVGDGCVQVGCGVKNTLPCTRGLRVPRQRGKACFFFVVLLACGLALAAYEMPTPRPPVRDITVPSLYTRV